MSVNQYGGTLTGTAAALGEVPCDGATAALIKVVTSGTETVSVTGQITGTTYSAAIMFYNIATGALHSSTNMDDGTYYLPMVYTRTLKFTGSSTSDTKTVNVSIIY